MSVKEFAKGFREFTLKGNMIDLAVGVVIGAAFGKMIDSFVKDIIMPPIGALLGNTDFSNLYILIKDSAVHGAPYASLAAAQAAGAITINIGMFINTVISFVIIALSIFFVISMLNKLRNNAQKAQDAVTKQCPFCMSTIDIKAVKCPFCTADLKK